MVKEDTCNSDKFKDLYFNHADGLRNFIYYKSGHTGFAEDSVQEAFLRLWKNCAKVPFEKAKSFLYSTAINLFRDRLKHQKVKLKFVVKNDPKSFQEDPQFLLEEKEFKTKLEEVIGRLPEDQRTVFLLNRIDKLKYREIAELLNVSQKTVEKRMHQALLVIRAEIGNI